MPSNFTGNPNITFVPSAAPGPGVSPTVVLPSDGDPANAASFVQPPEALAGFVAHLQSAARWDTPVVPASGSGFTIVSPNSTGGTITPSGAGITSGARYVVQIQTGGPVGTATFKTSTDGGATYGALQTTAASMTDATTNTTFAFAGTFTALGTASFRPAYTPLAQWRDSSGNGRFLVDHNGYPGGRVSTFREEWVLNPGSSGSAWATNGGAGGSALSAGPNANYGARYTILTPATAGAGVYNASGAKLFMSNSTWLAAVMEFELGLNSAAAGTNGNVDFYAGFGTQGDTSTDTNVIAIGKLHGSTNYQLVTSSGGGLLVNNATSVAPSANPNNVPVDRIKLEIYGSATPIGAYTVKLLINEGLAFSFSPANVSAALLPVFSSANTGGAPAGSPVAYMGPVTITWNRFLNSPAL